MLDAERDHRRQPIHRVRLDVLRHENFGDLPAFDPIQENNAAEGDRGASS
jgi:hypothetical protein